MYKRDTSQTPFPGRSTLWTHQVSKKWSFQSRSSCNSYRQITVTTLTSFKSWHSKRKETECNTCSNPHVSWFWTVGLWVKVMRSLTSWTLLNMYTYYIILSNFDQCCSMNLYIDSGRTQWYALCDLGIAEATDIWWTQTDRLWLWWSLVYNTSSMLCCVRPSANLRLAQPLPVGQQDPSKTKGRTATRLNCVLPGLPPISPNQNQQNLQLLSCNQLEVHMDSVRRGSVGLNQ